MKLTVFNAENMPQGAFGERSSLPKIILSKVGSFTLNKSCADLLEMSAGDSLSFAQDDDGNWYIYKDDAGFKCRLHSDKKCLTFSHSQMNRTIKESMEVAYESSLHFIIAGQPNVHDGVKYWGLIVRASV
jgi:hypothetical protein